MCHGALVKSSFSVFWRFRNFICMLSCSFKIALFSLSSFSAVRSIVALFRCLFVHFIDPTKHNRLFHLPTHDRRLNGFIFFFALNMQNIHNSSCFYDACSVLYGFLLLSVVAPHFFLNLASICSESKRLFCLRKDYRNEVLDDTQIKNVVNCIFLGFGHRFSSSVRKH